MIIAITLAIETYSALSGDSVAVVLQKVQAGDESVLIAVFALMSVSA